MFAAAWLVLHLSNAAVVIPMPSMELCKSEAKKAQTPTLGAIIDVYCVKGTVDQ